MVIGLERETYQVSEDGKFIEVCAIVSEGSLERTVLVLLETSDVTAKSKITRRGVRQETEDVRKQDFRSHFFSVFTVELDTTQMSRVQLCKKVIKPTKLIVL